MMQHWNMPLLGGRAGSEVIWEPVADRDVSSVSEAVITWTSDYDAVLFDISNAKPATDNVEPRIQLSGDGGSTFDGGASDYFNRSHFWHTTQTTAGNAQAHVQLSRPSVSAQGNQPNEWCFARLILARPLDPATKTQGIGWGGFVDPLTNQHTSLFFMQRDTAKRTDGLRFYFSSGNIAEARIVATGVRVS